MKKYEYMRMPMKMFPEHTIQQYNLRNHVKNGLVYVKLRRAIDMVSPSRKTSQQLTDFFPQTRRVFWGQAYAMIMEARDTANSIHLCSWWFWIKYVGKEHAAHLLSILERNYPAVSTDWTESLYCGITLKWNYKEWYRNISMLEYIRCLLAKYNRRSQPNTIFTISSPTKKVLKN